MDRIVATIHPFVLIQEISVYKNDECIKNVSCSLTDMEDTIYTLCKEFNVNKVDIAGGQLYGLKIKEHFAANKFNNSNQIDIEIH